ncbi:MAG: hypothetical protein O3A37_07080 [Planctomycetota bacterium]|nr:hypothetical protein [Planctomycetota bacterium]
MKSTRLMNSIAASVKRMSQSRPAVPGPGRSTAGDLADGSTGDVATTVVRALLGAVLSLWQRRRLHYT